jgi:hypothetical protein
LNQPLPPERPSYPPVPAELLNRLSIRYSEGATLDQLAVEFERSETVIARLLDAAGVQRRMPTRMPPQSGWFDLNSIPLERQKEIAEAYRLFPAHEVAGAYGIPIRAVERIAARCGVRKRAPNGYHRVRDATPAAGTRVRSGSLPPYWVTALLEVELAASNLAEALALVGTTGTPVKVVALQGVEAIRTKPDD